MTREEDLIRIAKKLDKMVSRNNTEGAMDLLKELKSFNMTLKLLQETRIGMSVNGIRKHCTDEEVIALAKVLIKDWKRLLDSGHDDGEKAGEMRNGLESGKTPPSPNGSPGETRSSHRTLDVKPKHDSSPDKKQSDKNMKEKQNDEHKSKKRRADVLRDEGQPEEPRDEKQPREKPSEEKTAEDQQLSTENKKQKHAPEPRSERCKPEARRERAHAEPKKPRHVEELRRGKPPEESRRHGYTEDTKKERAREDGRHERPANAPQRERLSGEFHRDKPVDAHRPLFERKGVLDSSILYPTRCPSPRPARPPLPVKRPPVDAKKERKDGKDASARHPPPPPPPHRAHPPRPASPPRSPPVKQRATPEVKKESRKLPADPNAPVAPLPLHLHPPPPPPRKEPPDPNAPLPPLPFHLHPPPPPPRRVSLEVKKDKAAERKESSEPKPPPPQKKHTSGDVKKDRKDSSESKVLNKTSGEAKRERKDSSGSKSPPPRKLSLDIKKEKPRKDSTDSKATGQPVKRPSSDSKPDRRESTDSKKSSSTPAKKLSTERRESHGSKSGPPGPPQRKPSTDNNERKAKVDAPKTPTTPTSPMSPGFTSPGGPLSPHLSTGDSVRDKCIAMITAALRTDDDYKVFGANTDGMAAEIEDHIYQEIRATDMKYKNRVRSRISNLKDPKNPGLRKNVLAGNIELSRIATMTAEEMASDELKQLRSALTQEAIREHQMAKTGGTSTDLLQCGKCKKRNCTYNQVQTRSADEPMTTFVLCNECGNRWKFC